MPDILDLAVRGRNKARFAGAAHHLAAAQASRMNTWLGVPVVVLTSIVATSIFGSISKAPPSTAWQVAAGFVSLAAAVLSALQTFFRFADRATMHLAAASSHLAMRRKLDLFLVRYGRSRDKDVDDALDELTPMLEELEGIANRAPVVSDRMYKRGKNRVMQSEHEAGGRATGTTLDG